MKIIIIDDRKERKHQHLSYDDLNKLSKLCVIRDELPIFQDLEEFSILAIHESLLKESITHNKLLDYVKVKQKILILFSGGITQNSISDSGKILKINSADFYSKIINFIEAKSAEQEYPLLKLLYGQDWRISLLLQYQNLIWIYGNEIDCINNKEERDTEEYIHEILMPSGNTITSAWIKEELEKILK